jgi:hypothetical protein
MHRNFLSKKSEGRRSFGRSWLRWENTIRINLQKWCVNVWTEIVWHGRNSREYLGETVEQSGSLAGVHTFFKHALAILLGPCSKADSISATQELPCILWNPKVRYPVLKISLLSQMNPVRILTPCWAPDRAVWLAL